MFGYIIYRYQQTEEYLCKLRMRLIYKPSLMEGKGDRKAVDEESLYGLGLFKWRLEGKPPYRGLGFVLYKPPS